MEKIDYQITDKHCEEALMELEVISDVQSWLAKYKDLFESVSIQPSGLPSIANQHFEGVKYTYIGQFHREYQKKVIQRNI